MKKTLGILIVCALMVLTACSGNNEKTNNGGTSGGNSNGAGTVSEPADPYAPMSETVTIEIGKEAAVDPKLPDGSTIEDNELTRYFGEKLNIKYTNAWQATTSGDAYMQKVGLTLSTGDIPDVMTVDKQQLVQLVNADLIEDLSSTYESFVSPALKAAYDSTDGYSLASATFDGKLMAFPNVSPGADAQNLLWVRQDWLDELGLEAPKTMDDIINVTKAFMDKKGSAGLLGNQVIVNIGTSVFGFDSIFSAYNAYPQLWVEDASGNAAYGSIQPEVKDALAKLRGWVEEGLIDKEFAVKKSEQVNELVVSGKAGIFFGPWWLPFGMLADSVAQDSKAEWVSYLSPLSQEGKMNTHMGSPTTRYLVVKKGFKHPEAVLKTLNMQFDADQLQGEGIVEKDDFNWMNMPFSLLVSNYDDKEKKAKLVQDVIDGNAAADTLQGEAKQIYNSYLKDKENPKKDLAAWSQRHAFLTGALPLGKDDQINRKVGVYYDQTDTMRTKWANLRKLEDETFLKIIMGNEPLDSFDGFVDKWKSQGGDQITEEIAAAAK
ncbi:putative aldouronate transport system substrate-binding protein [Paenibacillus endophyticus]|uniref:Putative aldouronate transport system substrate-binding protein n=1 Tax=Paenibacillus endophyticus TaxID=1294268 RepID=A0A7W5CA71_9BACL|nr:extracellular solute-binding protein [Paenibacillus endophyticus]MBB3153464.1 putative aldouronate transport system substrate-binding protein [Paenibacillus endophyticus]